MEIIVWSICLIGVTTYSLLMLTFLSRLYKSGLLIEKRKKRVRRFRTEMVYFSQDIFDVFWLVIFWLPLSILTCFFILQMKSINWCIVLCIWAVFIICALCIVSKSTTEFNKNGKVWSNKMANDYKPLNRIYGLLGVYNAALLCMNFILTMTVLWNEICGNQVSNLAYAFSLSSSLIFLVYFIMNTLSKLATEVKLRTGQGKDLFPLLQIIGGCAIILLLSIMIVLCLYEMQNNDDLKKLLGNIVNCLVVPCIPIAIQLVQIVSPLSKE